MSMTPDEKFNHDVWWILQEIKREQLYTLKEEMVNFALRLPLKQSKKIDDGMPSAETQRKLLSKLKEWDAFDLEPTGIYFDDQQTAYLLVIHQSKFDELYGKYKESCDLQTYLNTRQQKMYDNLVEGKGGQTDLPKFLNPEDKTTQAIRSPGSSHAHTRWNGLQLDLKSGRSEYNGKRHVFKPSKPHFKVLKALLEANGKPVTYDQFFVAVDEKLRNDMKSSKEYIRQKIRDIRKYFGINRRKNRDMDIFYDTGDGFQLMHL